MTVCAEQGVQDRTYTVHARVAMLAFFRDRKKTKFGQIYVVLEISVRLFSSWPPF